MAVVVKYIVVRNGEEKMTFVTKKEADAYDKMLDIADNLFDFFQGADVNLDEKQKEEISFLLADRRDEVMPLLRGVAPQKAIKSEKKTADKAPAKKMGGTSPKSAKSPAKVAGKPRTATKKKA
ncbi:MAG: hypothetical protein CSA29_05900 [Desulfobacterales bacterium]|nr:MAG: hypothetical protein CSA29_05900 [Desulfobacterales bacterium]